MMTADHRAARDHQLVRGRAAVVHCYLPSIAMALLLSWPVLAASAAEPEEIDIDRYLEVPSNPLCAEPGTDLQPFRKRLSDEVRQLIEGPRLAPLRVAPGLGGCELFFDQSGETFYALSLAWPHLPREEQARVRAWLVEELRAYPPHTPRCHYPEKEGRRRELYHVPADRVPCRPHEHEFLPLGNLYALWLFAARMNAWQEIEPLWKEIDVAYRQWLSSGWSLDPHQGDLNANRYLSGLIGYARIARHVGQTAAAAVARSQADRLAGSIVANYYDGVTTEVVPMFQSVAELDRWLSDKNGGFFFPAGAHNRKIARYEGLTPEVGRLIAEHASAPATRYMAFVDRSLAGWYLTGEERQFHFGENFMDTPDFALAIFRAKALIHRATAGELARYVDIPWCAGDLYHIEKLALVLSAGGAVSTQPGPSPAP